MGIMDNIKGWFFSPPDDIEDDEPIDDEPIEEVRPKAKARDINEPREKEKPIPKVTNNNINNGSDKMNDNINNSGNYSTSNNNGYAPQSNNNINHRPPREDNSKFNINVNANLEVVLVKPEVYTDAKQIADHIISGKTVVLNLESASPETKRRIIDFLAGVAYAKNGAIKSVANLTYIITPSNVGFVGDDLVGELENSGAL